MKAVNYQNYDHWNQADGVMTQVIYLEDHRRVPTRRKKHNTDTLWNVIFVGLCLSVLVVLFFH